MNRLIPAERLFGVVLISPSSAVSGFLRRGRDSDGHPSVTFGQNGMNAEGCEVFRWLLIGAASFEEVRIKTHQRPHL
jgi:hypothetical protein